MSKIILTKAQAEFIEGFKKKYYFSKDDEVEFAEILPSWAVQALHNLMQFGFGKGLEDANGKEVSDNLYDLEGNFKHDQVPLLIEAVMHGYEVEKEKVILFIEFSDNGVERKLYYGAYTSVTDKTSASKYDLNIEREAKKVEELKAQGWEVEEAE